MNIIIDKPEFWIGLLVGLLLLWLFVFFKEKQIKKKQGYRE